ncbi:g3415 [Coccomyxa elongata]
MVQSAKRMAASIFSLLLAGGCAARHLRAEEPSIAALEPENIAAAGAPGAGLQDPDHVSFAQFPTTAIAPAPAPQEWYGRLTGEQA